MRSCHVGFSESVSRCCIIVSFVYIVPPFRVVCFRVVCFRVVCFRVVCFRVVCFRRVCFRVLPPRRLVVVEEAEVGRRAMVEAEVGRRAMVKAEVGRRAVVEGIWQV